MAMAVSGQDWARERGRPGVQWTVAGRIPAVSHEEAGQHARTEYERLLALLESLTADDWEQRTYCTEWNVRDMAAHLAGAMTGSASFREFKRQNVDHPYVKQAPNGIDGTNRLQIEERADWSTDEVIAEFRRNGPTAIANRQRLPWLVRCLPIPNFPGDVGYLMDVIYPRDEWMHRYDICAATGREMVTTPAHDGRMTALVVRDIAQKLASRELKGQLAGRRINLLLTGPITAGFQFGEGERAECTIAMDVFAFHLRASDRITAEEATQGLEVSGDEGLALWFLEHMPVLY
jgi:uncharacterized protein (TIGR03083 family)